MTNPTIEECLELINEYKKALTYYAGDTFDESKYVMISSNFRSNYCAKRALALTPESIRESIQVREELVERKDAWIKCARGELALNCIYEAKESLQAALALTPESVAEAVKATDQVVQCLEHALAMGHFTPGGSTEGWATKALEAYRRALAPIPPKSENGENNGTR